MDAALNLFQSIGGALLALALLAVIGWVAITRIRAWMRQSDDIDEGFTLADLRRLHREGSLSAEEFERAQQQLISAVRSKPSAKAVPPTKARASKPASADDVLDLLETDDRSNPVRKPSRVRSDASGRIVIRDDDDSAAPPGGSTAPPGGSAAPPGGPTAPPEGPTAPPDGRLPIQRPKNPSDPRTDRRGS